jgi:hypothetical protein
MADTKVPPLSDAARAALSKLAAPEAIAVMEHMHQLADGDNNNCQNNCGHPSLSREVAINDVEKLPTETLGNLMKTQGIQE